MCLSEFWRHAGSFDVERGRFGTWLLSMTHHVAVDLVRKRQRRPQSAQNEDIERLALVTAPDQDVGEAAIQRLEAETIRTALRSLPELQKRAIELAYFGGLSHSEIATALGDPLGTVKTRIRRGMERLKTALEHIGVGSEHDTGITR